MSVLTSGSAPERLFAEEPDEERFRRITRTAARLVAAPQVLLTLLDPELLWVTARTGSTGRGLSRGSALCARVVEAGLPLVVDDLAADPRTARLDLVTGPPPLRAYLGVPVAVRGEQVGTLCALDDRRRRWWPEDVAVLQDLAAWAELELGHAVVERQLAHADRVRRQHESVLSSAGEGILGLDAEGRVTFVNPAGERMTGWAAAELVGRDAHDLLHGSDARHGHADGTGRCAVLRVPAGGPVAGEQELYRRDGSVLPVSASCAPILEDDRVSGAVVVFEDVTSRREVDRIKDEFISVVSHELRTPLTSIRGSLGLVAAGLTGTLPDEAAELVGIASSNAARLVRLVDDVLDLERLTAGGTVVRRRDEQVGDLLRSAQEALAGMAAARDVVLVVDGQPGRAWCDGDRVVQLLVNLMGNAVTYSPPGGRVVVASRCTPDRLELTVSDEGRGIPPDMLERVFDRFAQVDASDAREKGGSGLGLAIVRSIVEAHGGTITVDSELGRGTTFRVALPQRSERAGAPRTVTGRRQEDLS